MGFDGDGHPLVHEDHPLTDHVARDAGLLVGVLIHEVEQGAVLVEVLVALLVEAGALDALGRPEPFVQLAPTAQVLELDLEVGAALAGLGVLNFHRDPEAILMLDHHAGADGVAVDLHGVCCRKEAAGYINSPPRWQWRG